MTCKDCPHLVWFGDYSLHYCDITKDIVEESAACSCPETRESEKKGTAKK